MINLDDLTILNDLRARLEAVTEKQVEYAGRKLNKVEDTDTVLGEVSEVTRYLWALVGVLNAEISLHQAYASSLVDEVIIKEHEEQSIIAHQLKDVAFELSWAQSRCDTGFWAAKSVGLRQGWLLVECREDKPPLAGFLAKLGLPDSSR